MLMGLKCQQSQTEHKTGGFSSSLAGLRRFDNIMFRLGDAVGAGAAVEDKFGTTATLVALRQGAVVAKDHQLAVLHQLGPKQYGRQPGLK